MAKKTVSSKTLSNIRQVTGELTARQAHGSVPYSSLGPREAPRTARPPRPVYMALRGWLRRETAMGWAEEWYPIQLLTDMATLAIEAPMHKSFVGYVIRQEYPEVPVRMVRREVGGKYILVRGSIEYNMGALSKDPLDGE